MQGGKDNAKETEGNGEKEILADGWVYKNQEGSHRHYTHPTKPGKVTIPFHSKDLSKKTESDIRRQAGLK